MKKADKERLGRQQHITSVAVRDALVANSFARAVCEAASAAEQFLNARDEQAARAILTTIRIAHINHMRRLVKAEMATDSPSPPKEAP